VAGYLYLDSKNPSFSHSASYSYDGLSRLAQASGAPSGSGTNSYGQTFNYDRYGNMTCVVGSSGYCPQVSYYTSTNHINQIGSTSAGYDSAGNMTSDVSHTFQYDAEGRLAEGTNPTQAFVYNALGQRVVWGDAYFAVDPEGRHVAQWDGWLNAYAVSGVFRFGGQMIGGYYDAYTPANDTWMIHRNVLGSTSMVTDHAGTEISDVTDYPWGDVWIADASKEYHFAGFNYRFSALGIDPAINREYEYGLGRWLSPDPLGQAAANPANPQSWNRYAYVMNNPTTYSDPLGLLGPNDCVASAPCTVTVNGGEPPQISLMLELYMDLAGGAPVVVPNYLIYPPLPPPYSGPLSLAANHGCSTYRRIVQGGLGIANIIDAGLRAYALPEVIGALAEAPPAAGVAGAYFTTSIFGQAMSGGAQLFGAIVGDNGGRISQFQQTGDILGGPAAGLGTLMLGGSNEAAQRNANMESVINGGVGLVDKATPLFQRGAELVLSVAGMSGAGCDQ
jgi:RHS repeat-associated protein